MLQDPQPHDADQQFCISCGSRLDPGARFCGNCGAPISESAGPPVGLASRSFPHRGYMGFWIRLAAVLIDSILILILVAFLSRIFGGPGILVAYVFGLLYYVLLTTLQGQTLGKMVLGIQVVDPGGSIPSLGTVLLREVVGKFVSGLAFNLGYVWVAWDREKRAWHDHIAGTYVIRKERERVL
jgi:uncharacterized RDD family membrane protein YckC